MDLLKIVSKQYPLDKKYIPMGLMHEPIANTWIIEDVYYQFYSLNKELQKNGLSSLQIISGYRSYEYQRLLYNQSIRRSLLFNRDAELAARQTEESITLQGCSEHQLGVAIDVTTSCLWHLEDPFGEFEQTFQLRWLLKNSINYGFILRYPRHKTHITGVKYKPYHFRYVGISHAKKMKKLDLCLEEYKNIYF
ncbi:MAG: M15 family metallopeptidase [Cellulosilyticaceae bacterium]